MENINAAELTPRQNKRVIQTAVTPRPIAWISTVDSEGNDNLAPFSSYNYISGQEPVVMFNSPNQSHGGLKDTPQNILETEEFAVNVVTEPLLDEMDHTSADMDSDESEFDLAGLERADCRTISPPRVADAVVTMECTLYDSMEVRNRLMLLGDVQYFRIAEEVMTDEKIDMKKMPTVGRLGGPYYTVSEPVEFERRY